MCVCQVWPVTCSSQKVGLGPVEVCHLALQSGRRQQASATHPPPWRELLMWVQLRLANDFDWGRVEVEGHGRPSYCWKLHGWFWLAAGNQETLSNQLLGNSLVRPSSKSCLQWEEGQLKGEEASRGEPSWRPRPVYLGPSASSAVTESDVLPLCVAHMPSVLHSNCCFIIAKAWASYC